MKIEISHVTRYTYEEPATDSVNEIRLTPRTNYRQSCYHHEISIEPVAALFSYEDYFGNRVHAFSVAKPHRELVIRTKATVVTHDRPLTPFNPDAGSSQLEELAGEKLRNRYIEYLLPTDYTEVTPELLEFAEELGPLADGEVYEWVRGAAAAIYRQFVYDPQATSVHTTVSEMLQLRRGVCQDFTHLLIALCRSKGIPSRYVSGYHFVGDLQGGSADFEQASHAWVEVFIPGMGWSGIDPTNNAEIGWRYVKLAHGRDYKDIVPVKGVYRGTGNQRLEVVVDVKKLGG
ncbi:transglutaminase family protein [Paenibacillus hamazuiensis]|uniref:transglutaminase family protein n=1 Tax=Paenibacillus hamazuiensis TaxID=2936508 RepID=UPI00200E5E82|nr:transglutaminase family protein [Paenibacillus hamazuiensis]